ncbi:MAG: hypothetical protein GY867_02225 [bacterium]|nr:hypothetical protein [bacterium]
MQVLIISFSTLPASPSGPAYIAGAALKAGHTVEVFDCLYAQDLNGLGEQIARFKPDVIGISIKFVTGDVIDESAEFNTKGFGYPLESACGRIIKPCSTMRAKRASLVKIKNSLMARITYPQSCPRIT